MDADRHVRITERDLSLLRFVAEHRFVLATQAQTLLGASAGATYKRLRALGAAGLVEHRALFDRHAHAHWVTRKGLRLLGSELPPPRLELAEYRHDVGLAWLWLAARGGAFGALREIVSERQMRSTDLVEAHAARASGGRTEPFAVRLGGVGTGGRERLHYPDMLLVCAGGGRVAVELELTTKSRTRRERILAGYAADPRIDRVLYLVQDRRAGRAIEASARRIGISDLVRVQQVRLDRAGDRPGQTRARQRAAQRRPTEAVAR